MNGWYWLLQVELNEEEMSSLQDQLLPIIIGLLRTVGFFLVATLFVDIGDTLS